MLKIVLIVAAAYLALAAFMFFTQHRMIYFPDVPTRALVNTPADVGLHYEDVNLHTEDGVRLHGWWVPASGDAALLFFHGNAGNISHRLESILNFHRLGLAVLIIDYRGYGASEGQPSEEGTYRDAAAAWNHLLAARGIPPERIVVFGRSLGAAIAAWLAARERPAALIVESAFTSVPELGQEVYPWLPVRWLARIRYPTLEYVEAVTSPVLVVHSVDDEIAPYRHGQRVFNAASDPRSLLELRGSHNDAHRVSAETYIAGLEAFLTEHALR